MTITLQRLSVVAICDIIAKQDNICCFLQLSFHEKQSLINGKLHKPLKIKKIKSRLKNGTELVLYRSTSRAGVRE
jgi:hypothetical protein